MAVKIIIIRQIPKDVEAEVQPLLIELHQNAKKSSGYISGESLVSNAAPEERLVISSWESAEDWETFLKKDVVAELHDKVDQIIGRDTMYQVYKTI